MDLEIVDFDRFNLLCHCYSILETWMQNPFCAFYTLATQSCLASFDLYI